MHMQLMFYLLLKQLVQAKNLRFTILKSFRFHVCLQILFNWKHFKIKYMILLEILFVQFFYHNDEKYRISIQSFYVKINNVKFILLFIFIQRKKKNLNESNFMVVTFAMTLFQDSLYTSIFCNIIFVNFSNIYPYLLMRGDNCTDVKIWSLTVFLKKLTILFKLYLQSF